MKNKRCKNNMYLENKPRIESKGVILIVILTLVMALSLSGCGGPVSEEPGVEGIKEVKLKIGMMSSMDVVPYVIMQEQGIDKKYGVDLELETFISAKDRDAALQAGELDGVLSDYVGICLYQNAGLDVKITGITDGDYLLMAGKGTGITDMTQLQGKSIAISENTLIDYTLDMLLEANDLQSETVNREIVPRIPDRLELLRNDKIDLGLMPEPFATLGKEDGAVVLGSANKIGLYPAVSGFSQKAIEEKYGAICNLYTGYNEAVEYINNSQISEYEALVINAAGYPEEMIGKLEPVTYRPSKLPEKKEIEKAVKWAAKKGLCSGNLKYEQMVCDVY